MSPKGEWRRAVVVQLVERFLAKEEVASSNLVYRSGSLYSAVWQYRKHPDVHRGVLFFQILYLYSNSPANTFCMMSLFFKLLHLSSAIIFPWTRI